MKSCENTPNQIKNTFVYNGIRFLTSKEGNQLGECCIAFVTKEDADKAKINFTYNVNNDIHNLAAFNNVTLEGASIELYEEFSSSNAYSHIINSNYISKYCNAEKVNKTLIVFNMPINASYKDCISIFNSYYFSVEKLIYNEYLIRNYCCFLIELPNEEDCNSAKNYINSNKGFLFNNKTKKLKCEIVLKIINKKSSI